MANLWIYIVDVDALAPEVVAALNAPRSATYVRRAVQPGILAAVTDEVDRDDRLRDLPASQRKAQVGKRFLDNPSLAKGQPEIERNYLLRRKGITEADLARIGMDAAVALPDKTDAAPSAPAPGVPDLGAEV